MPGIRKTERAVQIAALGDFKQYAAGLLPVLRTETAIIWTALLDFGEGILGKGRVFWANPG